MRKKALLGVVLIAVGLLFITNIIPSLSIIVPSGFIYKTYPSGTSTKPATLTSGQTYQLFVEVKYKDDVVQLNMAWWNWNVDLIITNKNSSQQTKIDLQPSVQTQYYEGAETFWTKKWVTEWNAPSDLDILYEFRWKIGIPNANGDIDEIKGAKTYAFVKNSAPVEGTGYETDEEAPSEVNILIGVSSMLSGLFLLISDRKRMGMN